MTINKLLDQYNSEYPLFSKIQLSYSNNDSKITETLPPFLQFTTYLIEKFISEGKTRIGIVLPAENISLFPLIVLNCLKANTRESSKVENNTSVLDECEIGQRLRIGKSVVQYLGFENDKVKLRIGKKDTADFLYAPGEWVKLLEKTNGAFSKYETAKKELDSLIKYVKTDSYQQNQELYSLRTSCKKTNIILTKKNSSKEELNQLLVENYSLDGLLAYGEIDLDSDKFFKLYNRGGLDCLPWITISSRLKEVVKLLKEEKFDNSKIESLYIMPDKIEDIFSNTDNFEYILKKKLPTIIFFNESSFRDF